MIRSGFYAPAGPCWSLITSFHWFRPEILKSENFKLYHRVIFRKLFPWILWYSETEEIDFLTSADYSDFTFGPPGGGQYTTTFETTVEVITTTTATTGFTDLYTDSYSPCILQIVYKDELCGFGTEYKGNDTAVSVGYDSNTMNHITLISFIWLMKNESLVRV